MKTRKEIKEILRDIDKHIADYNRKGLSLCLNILSKSLLAYHREAATYKEEIRFARALYNMLLLDMDKDEEESILIAELSYLNISNFLLNASSADTDKPAALKSRIMLMNRFSDYLTDGIISAFMEEYEKDRRLLARNIAVEYLYKMQNNDMEELESRHPHFVENDEVLEDIRRDMAAAYGFSTKEIEEGRIIHKILYARLKNKYG